MAVCPFIIELFWRVSAKDKDFGLSGYCVILCSGCETLGPMSSGEVHKTRPPGVRGSLSLFPVAEML